MFQQLPGGRIWLTVVALAALLLVGYYLVRSDPRQSRLHLALGLVGGGAIGNLVDRIAFGRVTTHDKRTKAHSWRFNSVVFGSDVATARLGAIRRRHKPSGRSPATGPEPQWHAHLYVVGAQVTWRGSA